MDLNNLLQALQYSVGKTADEIKMAEQFLSQARSTQGYIPNLLLISCNREVNPLVRQAAIVTLKSTVHQCWNLSPENPQSSCISQNDRATLRESILDALINCVDTPKIYRQIEETIKHIADFDFPTVWRSILPNIINKLKTSDKFTEIFGSLLALKNLVANYRLAVDQERQPLDVLVSNTFPLLEGYAKSLLSNYSEESAIVMHAILKTIHTALENGLPKYFLEEKVLESWMTYFRLIIDKSLGPELESLTDDQNLIKQRAKNIFWLNKKNCVRIITLFITKYTTLKPKRKQNDLNAISQLFLQKYAVPFLDSTTKILYKTKEQYVPVKVQFYTMKYIYRALNYPELHQLLLGHLEAIMFDFLIPSMFLTIEDNDDWNSNPIEFIRKEDDDIERPNNLKSVAKDYFTTVCTNSIFAADGELFLVKFMKYAANLLTTNVNPRTNTQVDLRMKEAILHIIGVLKDPILESDFLGTNMEYLLEKYVIPEFKNQFGFLRARACWLFGVYGGLTYNNPQNVVSAIESLYHCLLDNDLPVRVKAGIAMNSLLRQPGAIDILKPGLQKILEIYISLIDLIDNDDLVKALEGIIEKFENDIHPYAVELIQHLKKTFLKVHNDNKDDGDEEEEDGCEQEERGCAATEYLTAIVRIIKCDLAKDVLAKVEEIVAPIIEFTFSEEGMDYVDSGIEILASLLYNSNQISEKMWRFFPELNYMIAGKPEGFSKTHFEQLSEESKALVKEQGVGWAFESLHFTIPCFQNYIQKGANVIFVARDPYYNLTYLELLFKTIDKVYSLYYNKKNKVEAVIISVLFISLLENYPKQIDNLVPFILDKVLINLPIADTDLKKILVQIAAMCFWYNASLCFQYLATKGAIEFIFKSWLELLPEFNQDYECQRLMFGLASILREDLMKLPEIVLNSLPGLLQEMVKLSSKTLVLREKDDDEEAEEDREEEKNALHRLINIDNRGNEEDDDDDEDDEDFDIEDYQPAEKGEYKSPLEDQCEVLFLKESLALLQQNQINAYNQLISCLNDEEKMTLQNNFSKAENQQFEFEKFKQEEDQKKQMRGLDVTRH